jgi:hypothetical protein
LVVEYQVADLGGELVALPLALAPACVLGFSGWGGSAGSLDRVGGGAEFVRGYVCDRACLASCVCGVSCCPSLVSGRAHRVPAGRARLHHLDLAAGPGAGVFDGLTRTRISRMFGLEQVQDVFSARGGPQCEEVVIRVRQGPTAADGHEPGVWHLRQDHRCTSTPDLSPALGSSLRRS